MSTPPPLELHAGLRPQRVWFGTTHSASCKHHLILTKHEGETQVTECRRQPCCSSTSRARMRGCRSQSQPILYALVVLLYAYIEGMKHWQVPGSHQM